MLRVPEGGRTKSDPSIIESDPRFGIEGALSAFDAQFTSNFSFEKNNRALNNVFFGGGTRILNQDFATCFCKPARDLRDRRNTRLKTRNASGEMVPIGAVATFQDTTGPYRVPRYNLYPAAELDGAAAPGYSQGQAIEILQKIAAETLPEGMSYEWTSLAYQQLRAGSTAIFAFLLAVVFVYLVLAAQYESLTLPLSVVLIVPMCLVAAITGVILRGQDNNILTQVGFIVLIGLAAKNAILIVEFAKQLEDDGADRWHAATEAARLRLRPILMTSLAFILGVAPLVWAIGAGAELRQTLGTAVFAGMIGVTIFGLVFTPTFYIVARWLAGLMERRKSAAPPAATPHPAE